MKGPAILHARICDFRIGNTDGNYASIIKSNQEDFARANDVRPTISRCSGEQAGCQ